VAKYEYKYSAFANSKKAEKKAPKSNNVPYKFLVYLTERK
jgi:hypothetical protein